MVNRGKDLSRELDELARLEARTPPPAARKWKT